MGTEERMAPHGQGRVYLDYAATTPVDLRVLDALVTAHRELPGNPSSLHAEGREARAALESARASVARAIGAAHPDEVAFCGSGTESDNLAVLGIARAAAAQGRTRRVVVSAFEHPGVLGPAEMLADEGFEVVRVSPTADGVVTVDALAEALAGGAALVSVMHANNEIGTVQDIAGLGAAAHAAGAYFHADCAQSAGKVEIDVQGAGIDAISIAGHKIYAPKGIGVLYLRSGTPFDPPVRGGGQEQGRRSGTPDVAGAVALAEALRLMDVERADETPRLQALRDRVEAELAAHSQPVTVYGASARRLPHLTCMGFAGAHAHDIMLHLDEAGFAVSTGSACSSSGGAVSHVLRAIGAEETVARGTIRVSLGRMTRAEEIDRFIVALTDTLRLLRSR